MADPFRIPDDGARRIVNFSGGRSSAYMLWRILDAHHGELPEGVRACFANTGKEVEATLRFVHECGKRWCVPITWVEFRHVPGARGGRADPQHRHAVVDFETASRNGEPFEAICRAKSMLPNVTMRFCTSDLKVKPIERHWSRDLGWRKPVRNVLGIRADEPRRVRKALMEECQTEYPLVHGGVRKADVSTFWRGSPFDLGIPSDEENCDLCFLKGRAKLVRLIRKHPDHADWWMQMEDATKKWAKRLVRTENAHFSKRFSYADLVQEARDQGVLFPDDEPEADCFCGD